jgi:predicted DNA-binding transcriptional regulator AlpA
VGTVPRSNAQDSTRTRVLTSDEAASLASIARGTWSSYVARGQAPRPVRHLGRRPVWDEDEVREWLGNRPGRGAQSTERARRRAAERRDRRRVQVLAGLRTLRARVASGQLRVVAVARELDLLAELFSTISPLDARDLGELVRELHRARLTGPPKRQRAATDELLARAEAVVESCGRPTPPASV